ncbi:MAG: carbohydrate kinase family protein [Anaerolineaceae bacterium]
MSPDKPFDILVAGEINPDLILTGDVEPVFGQVEKLVEDATLTIGSSSVIFACGAARLGLKVAFIGICGRDVFGRFMLDEMQRVGVDVSSVIIRADGQTGLSVILNRKADRAILTHAGLIAALRAEDVTDEILSDARHLHVASYFLQTALQPGLHDLFSRARSLGLTTSLDTNYDPTGLWISVDELLAVTHVLLLNEREAMSLAGASDIQQTASKLGARVDTLAIKLGESGAMGVRGDQKANTPSLPVTVVDTVGAGDSFDAGFIFGYLNQWDLRRSLRLGCVCGALSTQKEGGTAAQPTLAEALAYVS